MKNRLRNSKEWEDRREGRKREGGREGKKIKLAAVRKKGMKKQNNVRMNEID